MMTIPSTRRLCPDSTAITVEDTQCLAKFYEKNEHYRDVETDYDGRESLNRKIHFHIGDITDFKVDAIVCSTQTDLTFEPYGIHRQVTRQAGERYEESFKQVGKCAAGQAFITQGYDLHANYIIHTAGPSPDTQLSYDERVQCLRESYGSCLEIVKNSQDIRKVAFPCLGSGGAGLQLSDAIATAVKTVRDWLEIDHNITHVDSILLVMYDENQWNEYYMELFKTFPYGKDVAGIDQELFSWIEGKALAEFVPQGAVSSNILCFQYKKPAARQVNRHFHSLVNTVHGSMCLRNEPLDRYRNCGSFQVTRSCGHRIIIFHGSQSLTVEVQIICYYDNQDNLLEALCQKVQTLVNDYLLRNLENITRFKPHIRCSNSSWGDIDGMVGVQRLRARMTKHPTIQCRHRKSENTPTHTVNLTELARFWLTLDQESLSSYHPEPGEHDEVTGESEDSVSWHSLVSLSSSGSGGSSEQKQDNVTPSTGEPERIPIEHAEESSENTFGKLKKFVKNKIQVLTKSVKESEATGVPEETVSSNYQSFDDSLLEVGQTSQLRAKGNELDKQIYSNHSDNRTSVQELDNSQCTSNQSITTAPKSEQIVRSSNQIKNEKNENTSLSPQRGLCLNTLGACGSNFPQSQESESMSPSSITSLNDKTLLNIARLIGNRDTQLGIELNLSYSCIQRIKAENAGDAIMQAFCILREWKIQQRGEASIMTLFHAMTNCSIDTSSLELT